MARLIQKPKEEYLQHLRAQINKKFEVNISSANDCDSLIADIFFKTQHRLSNDTTRRLFTLKKSNSLPSMFTLDVCAQYLDYLGWEDFVQTFLEQSALHQKALLFDVIEERVSFDSLLTRINAEPKSADLFENFNKILLYKVQVKDDVFFKRIFEFDTIFKFNEAHKYDIYYTIHLLGSLCHHNDWLGTIAISHYHTLPFDENYFVEWLVVPQRKYYLPLLENYFNANKDIKAAAVFYHLMQSTRFAEEKKWDSFESHFKQLIPLIVSSYILNSILKMRWFGIQLYHDLHFTNGSLKNNIYKRLFNSPQINEKDSGDRITCVFIISHYLFQIEEYEMIIELFEQKAAKYNTLLSHWGGLNFNQLKVFYVLALLRMDRKEDALQVYHQIKVNHFDLNFKNQMHTLYEQATHELN